MGLAHVCRRKSSKTLARSARPERFWLAPIVRRGQAKSEEKAGATIDEEATWSEENEDGRWRAYSYDGLMARDKVNLDIFWLRDELLEETENLPDPDVIAAGIVEDLEAALEQFRLIAEDLGEAA